MACDVIIRLGNINGVLTFLEEVGRYGLNIAEVRLMGLVTWLIWRLMSFFP